MTGRVDTVSRQMIWPWLGLAVISLGIANGASKVVTESTSGIVAVGEVAWLALPLLFAALGLVIMSRQRANRIGKLLLFIGGGLAIETIVGGLLDVLNGGTIEMGVPPAALTPLVFVRLWINNWAWVATIFPVFLLVYVFPTGNLPSRKWIWAPRLMMVMTVILLLAAGVGREIGPFNEAWFMPNPIGFIPLGTINLILVPWVMCLNVLAGAGVVAMVRRYRRASYSEKTQIKLVLFAVAFFGLVYMITSLQSAWNDQYALSGLLLTFAVAAIPVSITIAILKYQLFDIDVIISRSLAYGTLAVFIGAVYVGIVVGIGELFGQGGGASFSLSIVATSLVALAFQPVRVRVERLANRLVYGERATPYEVLAQFSRRSSEESDDELLARVPRLLVDGTGASAAALWVRSSDGFRVASTWPDQAVGRVLEGGSGFVDPDADYSMPVFHDGELLGGISLISGRGEAITPTEEELLANLAGGMGLALRNTQLTARLRQQIQDLTRSRDRIVSAADQARRSLEHDLDSGPQQQLVAVKVKLGPTRILAEKAGAEKTAKILADIDTQAGEAIQAVRDFAGGIYPPLLEAEGLGVALGQQTRRAALPVLVHADRIGRYPREVETAVYFTVLEALQNTAKYADASSAEVTLTEQNGAVLFEVRDDGRGFDTDAVGAGAGLNGIADRMDSVGGLWRIESMAGSGTTLSGSVPVNEKADA
ncbi:MAG: ATP-binding protein [Acidimicrobiia bacterium]